MTRGADGLIAESDDWWQRDVKRPTATAASEGEISLAVTRIFNFDF